MELFFILFSLFTAFIILLVFFYHSYRNPRTQNLNSQENLILNKRDPLTTKNEFVNLPFYQIHFEAGEQKLSPSNLEKLMELVDCLITLPENFHLTIQGLADTSGSQNRELAKARATNVHAFLITKGIPRERLRLQRPLVLKGRTPGERKKYRSVTFELVSQLT